MHPVPENPQALVLREIFQEALRAVDPAQATAQLLRREGDVLRIGEEHFPLRDWKRIWVLGAGKATAPMARSVEAVLGDRLEQGVIVVKYRHGLVLDRIQVLEAGHPLPDAAGVRATRQILELATQADPCTLVLVLLSGGGSALWVAPADPLTLEEKIRTTELLLRAGTPIQELNTVRKHLSRIKGGHLTRLLFPARTVTLTVSDVLGDFPEVIASGPTVPDPTTYPEALEILRRRNLLHQVPRSVRAHLEQGAAGRIPETPKPGDPCFERASYHIVAGLDQTLEAAADAGRRRGYQVIVRKGYLEGEAREVARSLAQEVHSRVRQVSRQRPLLLLQGGETTVTVRGPGKGGRNQELALTFALEVAGLPGITLLAAGTDGTDGPTDAAGAIVDGQTVPRARSVGLDPVAFLEANDSYTFFQQLDQKTGSQCHLHTGPTGTNVMDVVLIAVDPPSPNPGPIV